MKEAVGEKYHIRRKSRVERGSGRWEQTLKKIVIAHTNSCTKMFTARSNLNLTQEQIQLIIKQAHNVIPIQQLKLTAYSINVMETKSKIQSKHIKV